MIGQAPPIVVVADSRGYNKTSASPTKHEGSYACLTFFNLSMLVTQEFMIEQPYNKFHLRLTLLWEVKGYEGDTNEVTVERFKISSIITEI